uniref:Uncharacterized protein n=1 Tax=Oryza sativa subsp. japonica TaxID=39947 RepID=Q5Z5R9_ORYSJ|nr:hypothetical protein [Oryza sativa Japonica Group]
MAVVGVGTVAVAMVGDEPISIKAMVMISDEGLICNGPPAVTDDRPYLLPICCNGWHMGFGVRAVPIASVVGPEGSPGSSRPPSRTRMRRRSDALTLDPVNARRHRLRSRVPQGRDGAAAICPSRRRPACLPSRVSTALRRLSDALPLTPAPAYPPSRVPTRAVAVAPPPASPTRVGTRTLPLRPAPAARPASRIRRPSPSGEHCTTASPAVWLSFPSVPLLSPF